MTLKTVSATEARVHFGELMRRVVEDQEPVIIERRGQPYVVVLSIEQYQRLRNDVPRDSWRDILEQIRETGQEIESHRGGEPLPPADEIIEQMREERNAQLLEACWGQILK